MIEKLYHVRKYAHHAFDLSRRGDTRATKAGFKTDAGLKPLDEFQSTDKGIPADVLREIWNTAEENRHIQISK